MAIATKLDKDDQDKCVDIKIYRGMLGSILYLMASRLNIMYSVCLYARFQPCPKELNLIAVKCIIRYLKSTINMGLWFMKTARFTMMSYSDIDYAGCKVDKKSTSGTCQFLDNCLVSWSPRK